MAWKPEELTPEALDFLAERHLATLSIPRNGAAPHVTPVGFSWDLENQMVRIITFAGSNKVRLLDSPKELSICQVDGGRWLTLSGMGEVTADLERCRLGEQLYGERYQPPKNRGADRRVIEVKVSRIMGRA